MSIGFVLFINRDHLFQYDDFYNHLSQRYPVSLPDFTLENLPDYLEIKIGSALFGRGKKYLSSGFEIYSFSKVSYPDMFMNRGISSDLALSLQVGRELEVIAALMFSSYFVENGGTLYLENDEQEIALTYEAIEGLLKELIRRESFKRIDYSSKIKKMLKRVLSEEGFTYWRQNAFTRNKNDVPQCVDFEKSRLWDSIWIQINGNRNAFQLYSDNRYQAEYFFTSEEDFYKQLDVVEQEIKDKWIPYLNRKAEEYTITTSLMKKYNEKTDEYVQKAVEKNCFPENIDELIDIVQQLYKGKEMFNKEQKDDAICMAASLYWEYLFKIHPEYKAFGGEYVPKCLISEVLIPGRIDPLQTAYTSFVTNDYDEFRSGIMIWDVQENSVWTKETEWEQKIY